MMEGKRPGVFAIFLVVILLFVVGFLLGVAELIEADSWVNGTNYIAPNTSWSDNIKLNGTVSGIMSYSQRFEGNGIGYLNRTMKSNVSLPANKIGILQGPNCVLVTQGGSI